MREIFKSIGNAFCYLFYYAPAEDEVKDRDYFIRAYFKYKVEREHEVKTALPPVPARKHFHSRLSIYGRWKDDNAEFKCAAALKMAMALQGKIRYFRAQEIGALRRGKLGTITHECEEAGLLPEIFLQQEKAIKENGNLAPEFTECDTTKNTPV